MTLDDLIAYGANVEEGLARCMNNEGFYLKLVESVKDESGFDTLEQAVQDGDLDKAFETAHSLKGVLGNLSITPLFEPMNEITELLRRRTDTDYSPLLATIREKYDAFCAL